MDVEIENYMKTLNLDEICRTCLSECDEMTSVYTEIEPTEDEISYVYQVLMNVASIQVMYDDGLPTLICKNCVESANNAFKFKILCERSEALLRTYLTQVSLKDNIPIENEDETTAFIEETAEIDHNYNTENVYEAGTEFETEQTIEPLKETVETIEESIETIEESVETFEESVDTLIEENKSEDDEQSNKEDQETTLVNENNEEENTDEEFIEHLEEEFQTDDQEPILKNLLLNKNFPKYIDENEDVDLQSVKLEIFNYEELSVQELIVKPDIPSYEEDSRNVSEVAKTEENIRLREKIKLKKLRPQNRVSKPRKKNMHHPTRINVDGEKMYYCTYCNKEYRHSTSLTVHIRSHTMERPFVCQICCKDFKQFTALTYHMRSHTGETPYKCTLCDKRYRQSASLTAHMRVHTGQRPFLCSVCGKGFRQAPDLGYHMRTHTKEKPYMCSVCGKRMSMQCHLVQHMRTHTGERPFSCTQCEKSFPSSTRLKRHEIIHTDLKPFECEVCSKSFNRASTLKVHVLTHSEERPHVCRICGKGFIQQHCLKSHLKSHCTFDDISLKIEFADER